MNPSAVPVTHATPAMHAAPATPATPDSMAAYYAQRAATYERVYLKPERQADLRAMAAVRFQPVDVYTLAELGDETFDAAFAGYWWSHLPLDRLLPGSSTPIRRHDAQGNTCQQRKLDNGSRHELLQNFPSADQAIAALGPRARDSPGAALT